MTERRGGKRVLTAIVMASAVLTAGLGTQTAAASTYPQPARSQLVSQVPDPHNQHGGASPSPGASPSSGEHGADSHVELPEGGQAWTAPDLVAQGALVRVETVADVYVALHHYHVEKYSYTDVTDPQAVASGTFVNAQGLVITSKGALHDDEEQIKRFGTWGINQAFVQAEFLKELPADPFARTTITSATKGRLADSPPTDPKINDRLQNCYDWETSHHCAVFVVMRQQVMPSVQDKDSTSIVGLPQSDARVATLSTQPRGITPLTLQLANPEPGGKYWVISSRGLNEEPLVGTGTLTDSERDPIPAEDLVKWREEFGELAEGAPVVSERGDLIAFLGTAEGSDTLAAVSASHMSNDLRTFGLTRDSSPVDAQFQDGLELFEASQFAAAVPKLKAAVEATGGQRVARDLLGRSEDRAGTAEDLSDEADVLTATGGDSGGWSGMAIAVFSALVILVLIGVGIAVAMARRRNWPDEESGRTENEGREGVPVGAFAGPGTSAGRGSSANEGTASSSWSAGGKAAGDSSTSPGSQLQAQGERSKAVSSKAARPSTAESSDVTPSKAGPPAAGSANATPSTVGSSNAAPSTPGSTPAGSANAGPAAGSAKAGPSSPAGSPRAGGTPNGHPARPTTLFATGTTDPKPQPASTADPNPTVRRPTTQDVGEAPTEKRAKPTPAPPARPSGGFCRQCGSQLSPGDRFCFSCGAPSGPSISRG